MTLDEAHAALKAAYDEADAIDKQVKDTTVRLDDLRARLRAAEQAIDMAHGAFESLAYAGLGRLGHHIRPSSVLP